MKALPGQYTTQLQAGLGLIDETLALFQIWTPGLSTRELYDKALTTGLFPHVTARRLRNIVAEGFAPRYLNAPGAPAAYLKTLSTRTSRSDLSQLLFLYTCRANLILEDYVRDVYWRHYANGRSQLTNEDARTFIEHAVSVGKTQQPWAESSVRRISAYLNGCCADFGLLASGRSGRYTYLPFRINPTTVAYLAYDLHVQGVPDNMLVEHPDWSLFGLTREEVVAELKALMLRDLLLIQVAGEAVRITWKYADLGPLCDVLPV